MSVWGTIPYNLKLRGFSWKHGINDFTTVVARHRISALVAVRIYLNHPPTYLNLDNRRQAHLAFSRFASSFSMVPVAVLSPTVSVNVSSLSRTVSSAPATVTVKLAVFAGTVIRPVTASYVTPLLNDTVP
ncbi:hypothetical protein CWO08_22170 [Vibrio sp. 10N.286.48.B8]|nr:hypothetical protein CWO08_22170 [Vibrio sp. 10N.286.48.B8]